MESKLSKIENVYIYVKMTGEEYRSKSQNKLSKI